MLRTKSLKLLSIWQLKQEILSKLKGNHLPNVNLPDLSFYVVARL